MNLKEALLTQAPPLALQRAAADEIARLHLWQDQATALIAELEGDSKEYATGYFELREDLEDAKQTIEDLRVQLADSRAYVLTLLGE